MWFWWGATIYAEGELLGEEPSDSAWFDPQGAPLDNTAAFVGTLRDVGGDPTVDLVVSAPRENSAFVYHGLPSGAFTADDADLIVPSREVEGSTDPPTYRLEVVRGSTSLDGDLDAPDASFTVRGHISPYRERSRPTPPADIDGDGRAELLVWMAAPAELVIFAADVDGDFDRSDAESVLITANTSLDRAVHRLGDIDNDGSIDLIVGRGQRPSTLTTTWNVAYGPLPTSGTAALDDLATGRLAGTAENAHLLDVDGDRDLDLIGIGLDGSYSWLERE